MGTSSFDYNKQLKLSKVEQVLSTMDLSEINLEQISSKLQQHLMEKPALRLNNGRVFFINEDGQKTDKKVDKLESLDIIFTVDKEYDGIMRPIPVTYTVKF
jgi:hypothetical protein